MIDMGAVFSFGANFIVIMDTFQTNRSETVMVQSLLIGTSSVFGVVSGALISRMGLPVVTLISSVLVTSGFCASFFATSIIYLYVSISVVAGVGISMACISCVVAVERVFNAKQRLACIAILTASNGVGSLLYPYLIDLLNESYGVRGTFLILGGLGCNTFAFFVLCWINTSYIRNYDDTAFRNNNTSSGNNNVSLDIHENTEAREKNVTLAYLKTLCSFTLFCLLLATSISIGALDGYLSLIMDITQWRGFNNSQGLLSIILYGMFSVVGNLFPGFIKHKEGVGSFLFPAVAATLGCLGQIILYTTTGFVFFEIGTSLCGIALGGILSSSLILVVELVQSEQLPVASGLVYTVVGVMSAGSGYGLGVLRDRSGTYDGVLVTIGAILGISAVLHSANFISSCRKPSEENRKRPVISVYVTKL